MPIITLAQAKEELQITGITYDTRITNLIPMIQSFVVNKCHNYFEIDPNKNYFLVSTVSFDNAANTISDSAEGFVDAGFLAGMDIRIAGSLYNNKIVTLLTAVAAILTLSSSDTLTDEDAGLAVNFTWVQFPDGLIPLVAKLIGIELDVDTNERAQAERVGNTSFDYGKRFSGEYPKGLLAQLKPWTLPVFV